MTREQELQAMTREQIINAIESDLTRSERLMKEVFEHCDGDEDLDIVYAEMKAIIAIIKARIFS